MEFIRKIRSQIMAWDSTLNKNVVENYAIFNVRVSK